MKPRRDTVSIYLLIHPETMEARYVGRAIDPAARYRVHMNPGKGCRGYYSARWVKSLKDSGLKPEMQILETHPISDRAAWESAECFWISYLKSLGCRLTNLILGSAGGYEMGEESRRKCSIAKIGKKFTEEHKQKLRETWAKTREARTASQRSPEIIAKRSRAMLGKRFPPGWGLMCWQKRRESAAARAAAMAEAA